MTKSETIAQLETLRNYLIGEDPYGAQGNDIAALPAAIKAVNKTANDSKTYTAFDVIRIVQRVVSDELCELDEFDAPEAYYKIERGIIAELVKEDEHETNV